MEAEENLLIYERGWWSIYDWRKPCQHIQKQIHEITESIKSPWMETKEKKKKKRERSINSPALQS